MRLLILFLIALSSCAMKSGRYTKTSAAADNPPVPSGKSFEQQFLTKINEIRTSGCKCGKTYMPPVPPLKWDSKLEIAALGHARDMYKSNDLNHTSSKGLNIKQRIEGSGYKLTGSTAYSFGENIASGQRSIDRVIQSWKQSEGHCKNLMNPTFKDMGVAQINFYWVQDFAMHKP